MHEVSGRQSSFHGLSPLYCKLRNISITSNEFSFYIHLLILFCLVFLGASQGSILCSLFLIYIKSNRMVFTVKQLAADDILLFIAMLKL